MRDEHYVIIGNGASANRAIDVLRDGSPQARITIISDEFFHFYYRHLLPKYVVGDKQAEDLIAREPSYYKQNNIRLRLGQKVIRIDFKDNTLYLKHMEKIHYSSLLLCLGGTPRIPGPYYRFKDKFVTMKTFAEAKHLREIVPKLKTICLIGGDLVSVKVASELLGHGKNIIFIIDEDSFWPLDLTEERKRELTEKLIERGAQVVSDDLISNIEKQREWNFKILLQSGNIVECQIVGAFFGLVPDVEFLYGSGIDIDRGILVDEFLKTNIDNVWAAGDCAQIYNEDIQNYWVSIGWENAGKLGEVAARNMLGGKNKVEKPLIKAIRFEGVKVNTSWWRDF